MKCSTPYCRNHTQKYRTICPKCRSRKFARKHPFAYHYNALKQNAKRRGKYFDLSFEEFKAIWLKHPKKWDEKKKWGHHCRWQMDRKKNWIGYTYDNIQIISKQKNIDKYIKEDRFHMDVYWSKRRGLEVEAPF